jgi:8-oxo-dGTP diphosphatase
MIRKTIADLVSGIKPLDDLEQQHKQDTLNWINSDNEIFRISKPNIPEKHLVSYFCLINQELSEILLVDHKNAKLWLPSGGHVEINEHPKDTVKRECIEELGVEADFLSDEPIFITSTLTNGHKLNHTDVSLWYVLNGFKNHIYEFDKNEFHGIKWYKFDSIPFEKSDPHMKRFIAKLKKIL